MTAKILSEKEQKQIYKAIELGTHTHRNRLIFSFGLFINKLIIFLKKK